jgi:hypothetical protein
LVQYPAEAALTGQVELAAMARHVVLSHTVRAEAPREATRTARIRLGGEAIGGFEQVEWLRENRAVRLTDEDDRGWVFVVYDVPGSTTTLQLVPGENDGATLVAQRVAEGQSAEQTISLLAVPTTAINDHELALYLDPAEAATVTYTLLDRLGAPARAPVDVRWDPTLGAYRVDLFGLGTAGLAGSRNYDERPELHNWYGRHRLFIDTHERGPIALPLAMFSGTGISLNVTGGVASLRDPNGEPLGVPVQISKNWHDGARNFYHLYSQPVLRGLEPQEMELTMASSRWGEGAYAASHGQLSLIGYHSAGGHWDESALGCFGESITYDPDVTLGRAMVDDVRPFLVDAQGRWTWTGNVGGADFLRYATAAEPFWIRRLSRVKSTYHAYGPNLTDVTYSGVTTDGRIQAHITTRLGRTDDLVRTYYHFDYTFLDDVSYDRLAFFQMAADRYGDNGFARYAYGNAEGVVDDHAIQNHGTTGYGNDAARGIPLQGDAPWVMLYDNQKINDRLPEHYADLAYVVRHFEADIGGTLVHTPHINIHRTNNGNSQIGFELGLPHQDGSPWCGAPCQGRTRFIPAGSRVRATVEYIVAPADKARYYGQNGDLLDLPAEAYRTPAMALELAAGNTVEVEADVGTVTRSYPVEIESVPGPLAAEFSITGGRGYLPVTVHGLARHDGWQLQWFQDGQWIPLDQSVIGNDYWQATYDGQTHTYALTYNVQNEGTRRYRLAWAP